jgi:outer membrane protein OmpA-like peptidoglycan-associated protein
MGCVSCYRISNLICSRVRIVALVLIAVSGCSSSRLGGPHPDGQYTGEALGVLSGAGVGMITGAQVGAALGPAAAVGAGIGGIAGSIKGAVFDAQAEERVALARAIQHEHQISRVNVILQEHFTRRSKLFPSRDIFPADLFFRGDEHKLCPQAESIISQLALINKERMPWSRLVMAAYVRSSDKESSYAKRLAEARARVLANALIRHGITPRRVEARAVVVDAPVVVDPLDHPDRYSQAIELLVKDR